MLGLEHETSRGSISLDYYGRTVGIKIMPTGTAGKGAISGNWKCGGSLHTELFRQ
jgi:trehalose 6-phosphate synthase/phosphatase